MDVHRQLNVLNVVLSNKKNLTGDNVTIADLYLAQVLHPMFRFHLDEKLRTQYSNVSKWFTTISATSEFTQIFGKVFLSKVSMTPKIAVQKEQKPKKEAPKKQAPAPKKEKKEENDDLAVFKKKENPLDLLPASKFVIFDFKTEIVNSTDMKETMK